MSRRLHDVPQPSSSEPKHPGLEITRTTVRNVLTRTGGYLDGVVSHSLQPYRGCPLGRSLCGVGCYVQHHGWVTRGRPWGSFLEVRENTADAYREHVERERRWARRKHGVFGIFLSSASEPFPPQERRHGVTRSVLEAMLEEPPDRLIVQTHSHRVAEVASLLAELARRTDLRAHLSIESDRDRLPGLPPSASPVERRFEAARTLRDAEIWTVITVAPLLPLADPEAFFERVGETANAVVIDHFVGGDGSQDGARTHRTELPAAMEAIHPGSTSLAYRDSIVGLAQRIFPGPVGVGADGFAGRYLGGLTPPERYRSGAEGSHPSGS